MPNSGEILRIRYHGSINSRIINKTIGAVIGALLLPVATVAALAASPFGLLDAHSSGVRAVGAADARGCERPRTGRVCGTLSAWGLYVLVYMESGMRVCMRGCIIRYTFLRLGSGGWTPCRRRLAWTRRPGAPAIHHQPPFSMVKQGASNLLH